MGEVGNSLRPRERETERLWPKESAIHGESMHATERAAMPERQRERERERNKRELSARERGRARVDRALEIDNVDDVATMSGAVYRHILSFFLCLLLSTGTCDSGTVRVASIKARQPTILTHTHTHTERHRDTLENCLCVQV